ncbi:hypothetical protein [Sphingomonas sp. BK580]|uniref:hypothetical protein n=1 Tax=Sphingomonas sp. BK580 TaxID=2586972 RepID=UPI001611A08D|nr:hypothetical protein [Sphingomonas sp. BK580]MBB3691446.1 hypothetical protein [Sphingomonas sp. BK580]
MQYWTITDVAGTTVLAAAYPTPSVGSHPKDNGWPWDAAKQKAWRIDAVPDQAVMRWIAPAWVEDLATVEASLMALVKATNEANVRAIYSTNFGKQKKYSRKQQEVLDFRSLSGALGMPVTNALTATLSSFLPGFATLSAAQQKRKFRFSMAQAKLRGVTIDVIIGEIEARLDTVEDQIAAWEAIELEAIRAIKAATTAAAKRAAYAAIDWTWKP